MSYHSSSEASGDMVTLGMFLVDFCNRSIFSSNTFYPSRFFSYSFTVSTSFVISLLFISFFYISYLSLILTLPLFSTIFFTFITWIVFEVPII